MSAAALGWPSIGRLGLVQMAFGSIVVLTTSTLNRVMVVELQLATSLPGLLVAPHYAVQIARPRWGYCSDISGRCTPWIIGGMALLALGAILAALATVWMAAHLTAGIVLAALAFILIGFGVGMAGTSLLVPLAKRVEAKRRPAAATIGREKRESVRMGLWGAAQAIAFGLGGFLGAASVDVIRTLTGENMLLAGAGERS